jgi:hypothetical protein
MLINSYSLHAKSLKTARAGIDHEGAGRWSDNKDFINFFIEPPRG